MKKFKEFLLILEEKQQYSSAATSINKNKLPSGYSIIHKKFGWTPDTTHIDIGGGKFDNGVEFLQKLGVKGHVYDPFNRTEEHNNKVMETVGREGAHSASLFNVLNVIKEPEHQMGALETAHRMLKPGGKIFVGIYEGDKSGTGKATKADSWQNNQPTAAYLDTVRKVFPNAKLQHGIIHGVKE